MDGGLVTGNGWHSLWCDMYPLYSNRMFENVLPMNRFWRNLMDF